MFQSIGSPLEPAMPLRQRSPAWLAVFLLGLCLFDVSFALPAVVVGQNTYTGWHCAFLSLGVGFITVRDPGHGGVPLLLAGFGNFAVLGFLALRAFRVSARLRFGLALFVLLATIPGSLRSLLARHATLLPGYFLWDSRPGHPGRWRAGRT